jgi:hypothetical protein
MRLNRQHVIGQLWILLGMLAMLAALQDLKRDQAADAFFMGVCGMFVVIVGGLTSRGSFLRHRGGWPTYVGVFFAFFGIASTALVLGSYFWRDGASFSEFLSALLFSSLAALFLGLGAKRHIRRSRSVAHART